METIELVRLACYAVNIIASFLLAGYFIREFITKRLRASLAWGLGFTMLGIVLITLAFAVTTVISKPALYFGFLFSATTISLLYYGTSLLFFREGSFFREKMTVILWLAVILIGWSLTYIIPADQVLERTRLPSSVINVLIYFVIGILFYQVSRRIPKEDPRRRTITLVAIAWFIITFWNAYIGAFVGEYVLPEAIVFLFGSFGFMLLLYGMTTGKTARR